tara:strand:+ start:1084 stop:1269 length:186 start_codon:yes stop_codon:yes gene_type:complete
MVELKISQITEYIINILMVTVALLFVCMVCKKLSDKLNKELFNISSMYYLYDNDNDSDNDK